MNTASFKTCMDAAFYPQTCHAPTTSFYIASLRNLLNMYVCGSQQSKSVDINFNKIGRPPSWMQPPTGGTVAYW